MKRILVLPVLVVVGCASRLEYVNRVCAEHPDWPRYEVEDMADGTTWVGMTEEQLLWVIDQQRRMENAQAGLFHPEYKSDYGTQESPKLRVYSIMSHRGGTYRTWTVDKVTGKVVDWYRSY